MSVAWGSIHWTALLFVCLAEAAVVRRLHRSVQSEHALLMVMGEVFQYKVGTGQYEVGTGQYKAVQGRYRAVQGSSCTRRYKAGTGQYKVGTAGSGVQGVFEPRAKVRRGRHGGSMATSGSTTGCIKQHTLPASGSAERKKERGTPVS